MKKILITGATGQMGGAVIKTLLKNLDTNQIAIITRNEEKRALFEAKGCNAYLGDYTDVSSLEKAMTNVDSVLLISAGDQGDRMQEHKNVVDAAVKMGVKNIAYTSRSLADINSLANKLMTEHFETEDYLKASGLNYIIFRNALYMDVVPIFVGEQVFEKGIAMPAGDGKVAYALRAEQAEAMANVLATENFENQTYSFTSSEAFSFYDVADALSELSGKEVKYTAIEIPAFEKIMSEKGMPPFVVQKIIDFNTDIKNGQEGAVTNELEIKLGRKPSTLKEGLKTLFNL